MYGTVARLRAKPGKEQELLGLLSGFGTLGVPGYRTSYMYRMDSDPSEFYLAVVFDSKETYRANAESPEQDKRYREMVALLEAAPEWHDGGITVDTAPGA
ncbi:MAG TPA: antibiotic biosynthesis monooxygenase family protein [Ktedonobacterales bacterium]|nr:antibiotic biosynthesis monooxygenase family protein [Ktedonobacterales bacterium]